MKPTYEKLRKNGMVAVVYSPGFGAGWATWAWGDDDFDCAEAMAFDADIASAVLAEDHKRAAQIAESRYDGVYTGGAKSLRVKWLKEGTRFIIHEYDGNESIQILEDLPWLVA